MFALRLSYTSFILIDDETPAGPMAVISRSTDLWKISRGALVVYVLILVVVFVVISAITSSMDQSVEGTATVTGTVIDNIVSNILGLLFSVGIASIYNDARRIQDGTAKKSAAAAAPVAPTTAQ